MKQCEIHTFYCINCGRPTFPIPRKKGAFRKSFHLKKLYCIHCKEEYNCVECRNEFEEHQFKEDFRNGVYSS